MFTDVFESEQRGVLHFRLVLMTCIMAYIEAFHRNVESLNDTTKKADSIEVDPEEDDGWNDLIIHLDVDHYVPHVTARSLFKEIIKVIDDGTVSLKGWDGTNNDSDTSSANCLKERAEFVSSMLFESTQSRPYRNLH